MLARSLRLACSPVSALALSLLVALPLACSSGSSASAPAPDAALDAGDTGTDADAAPSCSAATCSGAGKACVGGACVDDCRPTGAGACASGTACDFGDGLCKASTTACFLGGDFQTCGGGQCGPGTACNGSGSCVVATAGCTGLSCDASGRCWGTGCPCDRPAPSCAPAALDKLNQADFVGSPVNGSNTEGAFDLDFDEICNAYAVTMISGPDYLRQLEPDGTLTSWTSTTNLNMGQVAVLRAIVGEFKTIGDIAATYICCASCGCVETGQDGRLGVVHLDRASSSRPLPNVLPAKATSGTGPFGNASIDTGPYGLTWGGDKALYVGDVDTNGDYVRIDLSAVPPTRSTIASFPARVTAATPYDPTRLLVATVGGQLWMLTTADGTMTTWAKVAGDVTSLKRDRFTGRVYAEVRGATLKILEIAPDGSAQTTFQTPPRPGRIAIAPDGYLYHLSVFPQSYWQSKDTIVRWPLPAKR
jgi:hypothetical protein